MAERTKEQEPLVVPLEWHFPEDLVARYATNMTIQFTEHECHISFFEVRPPLFLGTPEEQKEQAKKVKSVRAVCVARIIVALSNMPSFVETFKTTLETHLSKQQPLIGPETTLPKQQSLVTKGRD